MYSKEGSQWEAITKSIALNIAKDWFQVGTGTDLFNYHWFLWYYDFEIQRIWIFNTFPSPTLILKEMWIYDGHSLKLDCYNYQWFIFEKLPQNPPSCPSNRCPTYWSSRVQQKSTCIKKVELDAILLKSLFHSNIISTMSGHSCDLRWCLAKRY